MWKAAFILIIGAVMAEPVSALAMNIAECIWMIRKERKNERR